jgi:hypothetical protein
MVSILKTRITATILNPPSPPPQKNEQNSEKAAGIKIATINDIKKSVVVNTV